MSSDESPYALIVGATAIATTLGGSSIAATPAGTVPAAAPWSANALVEMHLVDAQTGSPLNGAVAIPGTSYTARGWNWQSHGIFDVPGSVVRWPHASRRGYDDQVIRVEVAGYVPYQSPRIVRADARHSSKDAVRVESGKPIRIEARLRRDPMPKLALVRPDGGPAVGGQVAIAMNRREVRIAERRLHTHSLPTAPTRGDRWNQPVMTTTNQRGEYRLPTEVAPKAVVVAAHDTGFALISADEHQASDRLQLQPWGKIEGQAILAGRPAAGIRLRVLLRTRLMIDDFLYQRVVVTTDKEGRFFVEHATPGLAHIQPVPDHVRESTMMPRLSGRVAVGGVTKLVYGGAGRPVIGRITGLEDYGGLIVTCELPGPPFRLGGKASRPFREFMRSPAGKHYRLEPVPVSPDGAFRFVRVPPESYRVDVWTTAASGERERVTRTRTFTLPMLSSVVSDEPFDLGELRSRAQP